MPSRQSGFLLVFPTGVLVGNSNEEKTHTYKPKRKHQCTKALLFPRRQAMKHKAGQFSKI